ncbi:AAA family ATPase [Sulfurimonas sp. C5]|uniref:AAA family ATPase n=1 Tax=Sulfurimonas sp. C5 TaxID=3036947 RepID=UPI0024568385|nr:AAA family ATPase [Sulfurimonas sp. C5]MDH4943970.1 AAA family ATPase [Sulfurimonas sp. C5]
MQNSSYDNSIEELINEKIFDQQEAVTTLTKSLLQSSLLKSKKKVRALFTFIGLANSGKHYLAQTLLQSDKELEQIKTFNMEQYSGNVSMGMEQFSLPSISSEVTEFVKENPKSILFFEDIEKGDFQTQLALYSLFGGNEANEVDFSQVIVIMSTTRLGSIVQRQDFKELLKSDPLQAHTYLMEKLAQEYVMVNGMKEEAFDKKLLSLLNEHTVIPFNRLTLPALIKIAARTIHEMSQHFAKDSKLEIEYSNFDKFASLLTLSLSPYINARHIIQKIPELIFTQVYEALKVTPELEQIHFDVLDEAIEFVNNVLKEQNLFIKKISQQHMRITLDWEIIKEGKSVTCKIKNAFYAKEKLSILTPDALHVSDIKFSDVAGQQRVKDELKEVLALLKEPERLKQFDMTPPKGMFLYGPRGMGKKLLARAFAYESDMPYVVLSGAELFDAAKIHKAYAQAFAAAPAIVLLEDIDTPGVMSGVISLMSTTPVEEELDILNGSFESPVFTIATLSSVENIPEDLSKAGRLDIRIEVPKLDMEARRFFIEEVLKKPHDKKIDVEKVVRYISGLSGNELQRIGQEAALQAARKGLKELTEEILLEQINIIKYGTKLENKQIRDIEKSMAKTAYHEAGHAVLSYFLLPDIKIEQVTVAPRSETLGFVSYHNDDYVDATSKEELFNDVCVLLAGRIAKMEKFGEEGMETGAINDLEVASMQVYAAVALFGMDDEIGYLNVSGVESVYDRKLFSKRIEERMIAWIEEAKHKTQREVKRLWPAIEAVAKRLIKKEVIDGEELKKIINRAMKKK